ncbi:MAG: hypothetical protein HQK83_12670 [Fibrobacteria bacterium]|nr:hypothetical protein [Fibrobacteria bacterium]
MLFFSSLILICFFPVYSQQASPSVTIPDSAITFGNRGSSGNDSVSAFELMEINGSSHFTVEEPRVGDTLSYVIVVEWENPKIPFTVLAPESLVFSGFKKKGVSTNHKKSSRYEGGGAVIVNHSEFIYKLQANVVGSGKASGAKLPCFSVLSKEKEYFTISPNLVTISPARVPVTQLWYIRVLGGLVMLTLLAVGLKYGLSAMKQRKRAAKPVKTDLQQELKTLKSRLVTGDSQAILFEIERLAVVYLAELNPLSKDKGFKTLLSEYLKSTKNQNQDEWNKLQQDFEYAKFGGGQKASHEVAESFRILKKCLNINEDEDHE